MKNQLLIGAGMIAATALIVFAGSARSQEVGMPVDMTGFLCDTKEGMETMVERMRPDMDWDTAKEQAKGTTCAYDQKAGIIMSNDEQYATKRGEVFTIIGVAVEGKMLYTWILVKTDPA